MADDQLSKVSQTEKSVAKNISFFRDNRTNYDKNVQELDSYVAMRSSINNSLHGIDRLLDIGNGGVFDYDVSDVPSVVALDLFFDDLASDNVPSNVTLRTGSALDIPEPDGSFDGVLMVMLIHHLVGKTVSDSIRNATRSIHKTQALRCHEFLKVAGFSNMDSNFPPH